MEKLIAVPESQLTDIGDAIRSKRDITTPIPVSEMPLQISLIEGGGDSLGFFGDMFEKVYEDEYELRETYTGTNTVNVVLPKKIDVPQEFPYWYIAQVVLVDDKEASDQYQKPRVTITSGVNRSSTNTNFLLLGNFLILTDNTVKNGGTSVTGVGVNTCGNNGNINLVYRVYNSITPTKGTYKITIYRSKNLI